MYNLLSAGSEKKRDQTVLLPEIEKTKQKHQLVNIGGQYVDIGITILKISVV